MTKAIFTVLAIALISFSASAQKAAVGKPADPTQGVRDAFDRLVEGIKQVDADKVMNSYEKSDRLLIFNNNGTATIGWETIKSNVESTFAKVSNVTLDITGLHIEMLGRSNAYLRCKWKQTQEYDGKLEHSSGRMTLVYKLAGKQWKITHRHTSPDRPDATRPVFTSERQP
jgi:ketosteroid isomerase-like protein